MANANVPSSGAGPMGNAVGFGTITPWPMASSWSDAPASVAFAASPTRHESGPEAIARHTPLPLGASALAYVAFSLLFVALEAPQPTIALLALVFGAVGSMSTALISDLKVLNRLRAGIVIAGVLSSLVIAPLVASLSAAVSVAVSAAVIALVIGFLFPTFSLLRALPDLLLAAGVYTVGLVFRWDDVPPTESIVCGTLWLALAICAMALIRKDRLERHPRLVRKVAGNAPTNVASPSLRWWPIVFLPVAVWLLFKGFMWFLEWLLRNNRPTGPRSTPRPPQPRPEYTGWNFGPIFAVLLIIVAVVVLALLARSWHRRPRRTTPWEWELAKDLEQVGTIAGRRRHPSEPIGGYTSEVGDVLHEPGTPRAGDRLSDHVYGPTPISDAERDELFALANAARPIAKDHRRKRWADAMRAIATRWRAVALRVFRRGG